MAVDPFQARVAQLALAAAAGQGFALAGGNALVAHGLLSRPTEDVDLFTPHPGGPGRVLEAVRAALAADGFDVRVLRPAADSAGEFAQLQVGRDDQTTQVDLGRDWRSHEAVTLDIGPVLHLDDAVASKTTALLGRGLARDYIDVAAALERYSRRQLLQLAFERDPGLRVTDVALAAQRLDGMADTRLLRYGLDADEVTALRARFADWPREEMSDGDAHAAHDASHRPTPSAAERADGGSPLPVAQAPQQSATGPEPPSSAERHARRDPQTGRSVPAPSSPAVADHPRCSTRSES